MRGLTVKQAKVISSDERRDIISVLNGELNVKDIHILYMKKGGQILGNHWHTYNEFMYIMKGKGHWWMKHILTGEEEEYDFKEGDIVFKTGFITHTAKVSEDCVILDGSCESWIGEDFNHVRDDYIDENGDKLK